MKRILIIIGIIIAGIIIFLGVAYWHWKEQRAWSEWKKSSLVIDIPIEEKEKELGRRMTEKELYQYIDSFKIAHGIVPPTKCPYCFIEDLKAELYGKEE